jgi:hypothetical protein
MKALFFVWMMICSCGLVVAQESDSVSYEEIESESSETYEEGGAEETVGHTLVAPDELGTTVEYRSQKVAVRKFDNTRWKKIVGDTDYSEKKPEKKKDEKKSGSADGNRSIAPWGGAVFRLISYIVLIGVVILLLYLVLKNISLKQKLIKTNITREDYEAPVENIEEIDIDSWLRQARAEGNLRLAIRLYYLGLLKKLNETGLIIWKKDKTNRDYLTELFSRNEYFDEVKTLTLSYEQVWYGEHHLTSESFEKITAGFETIYSKLNTPKEP